MSVKSKDTWEISNNVTTKALESLTTVTSPLVAATASLTSPIAAIPVLNGGVPLVVGSGGSFPGGSFGNTSSFPTFAVNSDGSTTISTQPLSNATFEFSNVIPISNNLFLGNSTFRWQLYGTTAELSNNLFIKRSESSPIGFKLDYNVLNFRLSQFSTITNTAMTMLTFIGNEADEIEYLEANISILPTSNISSLGEATHRWQLFANTVSISGFTTLQSTSPFITFIETDASANTQRWQMRGGSGGIFQLLTLNDAGSFGAEVFQASRVETAVANIQFSANVIPSTNGTSLGLTNRRWNVIANTGDYTGTITIAKEGETFASRGEDIYITWANTAGSRKGYIENISNSTVSNFYFVNEGAGTSSGLQFLANGSHVFTGASIVANCSIVTSKDGEAIRIQNDDNHIAFYNTAGVRQGYLRNINGGFVTLDANVQINFSINDTPIALVQDTGIGPASNTVGTSLGVAARRWNLTANTIETSGITVHSANVYLNGGGIAGALMANNFQPTYLWNATAGNTDEKLWRFYAAANSTVSELRLDLLTDAVGFGSQALRFTRSGAVIQRMTMHTSIVPNANAIAFGNTIGRWNIVANTADYSGDVFYSTIPSGTANSVGLRNKIPTVQDTGFTFAKADNGQMKRFTTGAAITYTIANVATVAYDLGTTFYVRNIQANTLTIGRGTGVTLRMSGSATDQNIAVAQWGYAEVIQEATNVWVAHGTGLS